MTSFQEWSSGFELPGNIDSSKVSAEVWQRSVDKLRRSLRDIMRAAEIQEALFLASPGFAERFALIGDDFTSKKARKMDFALSRYYARLCGRPQPFGLFSGTTFGRAGSESRLNLSGPESYRRSTRLDVDYLAKLADALLRKPGLRDAMTVSVNSSVTRLAGRYHFVANQEAGNGYAYFPMAIEGTELLDDVIDCARDDPKLGTVVERLRKLLPGLSVNKAHDLIAELLDEQVLVPAASPVVTGLEPLVQLIRDLADSRQADEVVLSLKKVRDIFRKIDSSLIGTKADYERVTKAVSALPVETSNTPIIQTDLVKPGVDVTIANDMLDEISAGIECLHRWCGSSSQDQLQSFRVAFLERYGGREVPLSEVLDEELGIGLRAFAGRPLSSPLLDGLTLPTIDPEPIEEKLGARDELLKRRLDAAIKGGDREISFKEDDLELADTHSPIPPLPGTFAVKGSLIHTQDSGSKNDSFVFHGMMGEPATTLFGRACHADSNLKDAVEQYLLADETRIPEALVAEVVYCPRGRLGNIQVRPHLSEYEIPYLGRSSLAKEKQIPIEDLLVTVRDGVVELRSARLGKRIIPRMSSAHDFENDTNIIYRFLCTVQHQGVCWKLSWDWGQLSKRAFLPRVSFRRLVMSPATWNLNRKHIQSLARGRGAERFSAMQDLRNSLAIPRYSLLVDADEKQLFDFENALCVDSFIDLVRDRESAKIEEMCPGPTQLAASGPGGRFVHDLVIPFSADRRPVAASISLPALDAARPRNDIPESDWLYLKIYTGPITSDRLLQVLVAPLVSTSDPDLMGQWHFSRFSDPDTHLRLRFHGDADYLHGDFLREVSDRLVRLESEGMIWRFEQDVYEREIEKYGGVHSMPLVEEIFHFDSVAAISILASCVGDAGADNRWRLALAGADSLLEDFRVTGEERSQLLRQMRSTMSREFLADRAPLKHQISQVYRQERKRIETILNGTREAQLQHGLEVLKKRSNKIRPVVERLNSLAADGKLHCDVESLLSSLIHMQFNRLLRWPVRPQEMMLYEFLGRHDTSRVARRNRVG